MKVLMSPYSHLNPYQRLLSAALRSYGTDVSFDKNLFRLGQVLSPKFDLLHLHWLPAGPLKRLYLLIRIILLKSNGVPVVWTVHNLYSHEGGGVVELWYRRVVAKTVSKVICHCRKAEDLIVGNYRVSPGKVKVIPHGSYLGVYPRPLDKNRARERLGVGGDGLAFLYFGLIKGYKGVPNLVNAFRRIKKPAALIVVGKVEDPGLADEIKVLSRGEGRIKLVLDYISDEEVADYFSAADCVVLPYTDILTSGAAALAASFGRAVIAPKTGCVPDQLAQGESLFYDPADEEGLLKTMERSFREDLAALGADNLEKAQKLTWRKIARDTAKTYRDVLKR